MSSVPPPAPLPERDALDLRGFREEVVPAYRPVVLRGFASAWPAVKAARESGEALGRYLSARDRGAPVECFVGPPAIKGRFFYDEAVRGFNFERARRTVSSVFAEVLASAGRPDAPTLYMGAAPTPEVLPAFAGENPNPLVPPGTPPRVWLGGATVVSTHYDLSHNIACVVAGRRRFTLFPPEQTRNLYVGPLERTVAGQPISMVPLDEPDLARFPRFAEAMAHAQAAELGPGDALYVPPLWWHHVRALEPVNVLVNFWWDEAAPDAGSPFEALAHGLLSISSLPAPERQAWRAVFDHYVFRPDGEDPAAHLPPGGRGILGAPTPEIRTLMRRFLLKGLAARDR